MHKPKAKGCPGMAYIVKMEEKMLVSRSKSEVHQRFMIELRELKTRMTHDGAESRRSMELRSYKEALIRAKRGHFHEEINNQSKEVKKAFEELKALNTEIGKEVIAIHNSIIMCEPFPENDCSRLDALLGRADELRQRCEIAESAIIKAFDELRSARAVKASDEDIRYGDDAKHEQMPDQKNTIAGNGMDISDLSILKTDDLLQLRSLLMDIMAFYIWRHSGLALCHATVAAHRIAGSSPPQSIHQKAIEIKRVIRKMEGSLAALRTTGIEQLPDVLLFNNALRAHRAVSGLIPTESIDKDYSRARTAFMIMKRFSNKNPEVRKTSSKIGNDYSSRTVGYLLSIKEDLILTGKKLATSGRKVFLLQAFGDFFSTIGFNTFSDTPDMVMGSKLDRTKLAALVACISPYSGVFYTFDEVHSALGRSGFLGLMQLVPPLNFVMEHEGMQRINDALKTEDLDRVLELL